MRKSTILCYLIAVLNAIVAIGAVILKVDITLPMVVTMGTFILGRLNEIEDKIEKK